MSFSRKVLGKKVDTWESHFLFPLVGKKAADEPMFFWSDGKWKTIGSGSVGLVSMDVSVDDPISSVVWGPKTSKIITKSGASLSFPREYVELYFHDGVRYIVAAIPSVYTVYISGSPVKVLACFGYDSNDHNVILFNVRDLEPERYNVHLTQIDNIFPDPVASAQSMPAYSGKGVVPKEPSEVEKLTKAMEEEREERPYFPHPPSPDQKDLEVLKLVEDSIKREDSMRERIMSLIDPSKNDAVVQEIRIVNGKITSIKKSKVRAERERAVGPTTIAGDEYLKRINAEKRQRMGIGQDGSIPMPTPMLPKSESPPKPVPLFTSVAAIQKKHEVQKEDEVDEKTFEML
jgi:hypothetical protein